MSNKYTLDILDKLAYSDSLESAIPIEDVEAMSFSQLEYYGTMVYVYGCFKNKIYSQDKANTMKTVARKCYAVAEEQEKKLYAAS